MTELNLELRAVIAPKVAFASHQNAVPLLRDLRVAGTGEGVLDDVEIAITSSPAFLTPRRWRLTRVASGDEITISDRDILLDAVLLRDLRECLVSTVTLTASAGGHELAHADFPVEVLARDEWGGAAMTELLAAFVQPNDPAVERLLKDASTVLTRAGQDHSLNGYQAKSRTRVWELASAIWSATASRRITYCEPPASFEDDGQKIRSPTRIFESGLATCLDTACLFAAVCEQAGLHAVLVISKGHAFAGVWLQPQQFATVLVDEAATLRKRVAEQDLVLFETTCVTRQPVASFSAAVREANRLIAEEHEASFRFALDIKRARMQRLRPLALAEESTPLPRGADAQPLALAESLEAAPPLPGFDVEVTPAIDRPADRIDHWRRKLLDLTVRNPLLHTKPSASALAIICPDPGALEDLLAKGDEVRLVSCPALDAAGRDLDLHRTKTGEDLREAYARDALARGEILSPLAAKPLEAALIELYRKSRLDLQEGGANTLFLCLGFLNWKKTPEDSRVYRAPLLLVPVTLERQSARSHVRLRRYDDETRFNMTLLELLRQDFEISALDGLQETLPTDAHGIDVAAVWAQVRRAVRDVRGFELSEDVMLGSFSFAKYLMWKDLTDRADALKVNPVVRHLLERSAGDAYDGAGAIPATDTLDTIDPATLFTPLPADSSQLAAVVGSATGCDFVLDGPPGTGKSQTIANIIAHNLALGRKVLFVAEKMAALNVVYRRLEAQGLGDFCLELHSNKANKADVVRQLGRAWDSRDSLASDDWIRETARLKGLRDTLNAVVTALHRRRDNGMTLHAAIGRVVRDAGPLTPVLDWDISRQHDAAALERSRDAVRRLRLNWPAVADRDVSALSLIQTHDWSNAWQASAVSAAAGVADAAQALAAAQREVLELFGLGAAADVDLAAFAELTEAVIAAHRTAPEFAFRAEAATTAATVRTALAHLAAYHAATLSLSAPYDGKRLPDIDAGALTVDWTQAGRRLWPLSLLAKKTVRKRLQQAGGTDVLPDVDADLARLAAIRRELDAIAVIEPALTAMANWRGLATDAGLIERDIVTGERLLAASAQVAGTPASLVALRSALRALVVGANDLLDTGTPVRRTLEHFLGARSAFSSAMRSLESLGGSGNNGHGPESLDTLAVRARALVAEQAQLNAWANWQRARTDAVALDLEVLVVGLEARTVAPDGLEPAFEVAYARWWANREWDAEPALSAFNTIEHADRIEQFRALDDQIAALTARYIRARISGRIPSRTQPRLDARYAALRHQLTLKQPRKALRQLAGELGDALTTLTPCLLMSPLSVAQYLPVDAAPFDLVVLDEASQITPWDAIGAIARGKQVVVAGDPKQMPPTNFFGRSGGDTASDDPDAIEDLESILTECQSAGLPHHRLTWHYRSRNESLIAFSNHRYYDSELVTFPAPVVQDRAVSLRQVAGVYAKGKGRTNPIEARAIVDEAVRRLTDPTFVDEAGKPLSLAVVTLNAEQQKLIEDLLDQARRTRPELEAFFGDGAHEPVLVKNLETVQGDERDVILFGIGYGPDVMGAPVISMNFGPLNRDGGWRRLNVAITRARRECTIFTSFPASMIDLNRTSARAVRDLRDYMDFAERGARALVEADRGSVGDYESPFEQAVARALRDRGWEVISQIGVSRFRIDLGVVHPERAGTFLAGVECDGASYHSAATARDRDKVREAILHGLGWDLVRVWSTDWWTNKAQATDSLDRKLRQLLHTEAV